MKTRRKRLVFSENYLKHYQHNARFLDIHDGIGTEDERYVYYW